MANEITGTIQLQCVNGNYSSGQHGGAEQITQTAVGAHAGIQLVGTTEETLSVGDVTTYGVVYMKNLDGTNFVTYGSTLFEWKLKAGEQTKARIKPGATINVKADTAAIKLQVLLLQD